MKVLRLRENVDPQDLDRFQKHFLQPVAVIGDVHGCYRELNELIEIIHETYGAHTCIKLVGDAFDRGPDSKQVFEIIKQHTIGSANGNHDDKFRRWLKGNPVKVRHALRKTISDFGWSDPPNLEMDAIAKEVYDYLCDLPPIIEHPAFQIVHAQPAESDSQKIRGEKRDFHGVEIRWNWWESWKGKLTIFGHYWFDAPIVHFDSNGFPNAIGIDTQCVLGNTLTAVVLPHLDIISIPSHGAYDERDKDHVILSKIEQDAWRTQWT